MSSYDSSKASSYLMYYDVNNLYGWAMRQPLPYAEFKWANNIENFNVASVMENSEMGYLLEVDIEYPPTLHKSHADLPFCPVREKPPNKREKKLLATVKRQRALRDALSKFAAVHRARPASEKDSQNFAIRTICVASRLHRS